MNSARMMLQLRGWNSTWLVITVSSSLCLWCLVLGAPIQPLPDPSKPSTQLVDSVSEKDVLEWMVKYKIILPGQSINFTEKITLVQQRAGINVTGVLDFETKKLFVIPRCGNTEPEDDPVPYGARSRRDKSDYIEIIRRIKQGLKFLILNYTSDLPKSVQEETLSKMMSKWANAIPQAARIRRQSSFDPDEKVGVLVLFVKGNHSDSYPFDGSGGTIGHAVHPDSITGFPTEVHFDDDEIFTSGTSGGINLDWAALHEFGHNVGLQHSNVRESAMYPWYKGYIPNIELSNDDINQLQALYGRGTDLKTEARTSTTKTIPSETTTTEATTTKASASAAITTKVSTINVTTSKAPMTEATTTKASATEATTTEATTTEATTTEATTTEEPTTEATTTEATTTEATATEATTTEATTTEATTTEATTTEATTTEEPTTEAITTEASTIEASTKNQTTEATAETITIGDPSNPSPEVINSVTYQDAIAWMLQYNIIKNGSNTGVNFTENISVIQRKGGIAVTGELDFETKKLLVIPRCGNTDDDDGHEEPRPIEGRSRRARRQLSSYLGGICDQVAEYIFTIVSYTADMPVGVQQQILSKSLDQFFSAIPQAAGCRKRRSFDPVKKEVKNVSVSFVRRGHGDPFPFDGAGGTIGHVIFPVSNTSRWFAEVHFDDDETFTSGTRGGINLEWLSLHEFGHSFGLKHSNIRESVMYPWYKGYIKDIKLTNYDVQNLQALYATEKPTTEPDTTTQATPKVTTQPSAKEPTTSPPILDVCQVQKFDSFLMGMDGRTYVFSGDYFWVLSVRLTLESGPIKIASKWKELKTPIDSAYTNRDGRIVFFKENQYWKYNGYVLEQGPGDISHYGLPSSLRHPDIAFVWGGNKKTYFFKGNNYWRYNEFKGAVDDNYPKPITVWGLPHHMDTAMTWGGNKRTYFFKGGEYWRFDDGWFELEKGYPRSITAIWMKC